MATFILSISLSTSPELGLTVIQSLLGLIVYANFPKPVFEMVKDKYFK